MYFIILTIYQYSKASFFKILLLAIMYMLINFIFFTYASVAFHSSKSYAFKGGEVLLFMVVISLWVYSLYSIKIECSKFSQNYLKELKINVIHRLDTVAYDQLESYSIASIQTLLTSDISQCLMAFKKIGAIFISMSTSVVIYLFLVTSHINWLCFLMISMFFVFTPLTFEIFKRKLSFYLLNHKQHEKKLFSNYLAYFLSIRLFVMNVNFNHRFVFFISSKYARFIQQCEKFDSLFTLINSFSNASFYVMIFLVSIFGLQSQFSGLSLALLIYGLKMIQNTYTQYSSVFLAKKIIKDLQSLSHDLNASSNSCFPVEFCSLPTKLTVSNVVYTYRDSMSNDAFHIGPVNLSLQSGKCLFVTGHNGSGKSTLMKIVTGLYSPNSGEIRVDNSLVRGVNPHYRSLFSAVFDDVSFIEGFSYLDQPKMIRRAENMLAVLNLDHVVTIKDGSFSTIHLSKGQLKRLALVLAYALDRPFYIFDEWAAEQDPFFRKWFYQQFIPQLKRQGKAVMVITHDDRFFHLADELLELDSGHSIESQPHVLTPLMTT
ncbi:MAG: hypothetical protein CMF55_05430 [Legionellales bacterium]|nr:hypothetical protein [Legionellales bacterium]